MTWKLTSTGVCAELLVMKRKTFSALQSRLSSLHFLMNFGFFEHLGEGLSRESRISNELCSWFCPWPGMRVISLSIRTATVFSVPKEFAAAQAASTAPAAKCGLIRQDEAD